MRNMGVLRYQYQGVARVIHSIGLSKHPGEIVIELYNVWVVQWKEFLQLGLRESLNVSGSIWQWLKFHTGRLYDDIID